jgi:hypothetical protein
MGQSYRIRTELGVNKTINVQLDQEFEQLEILSLKLQQADVYTRSCADYGVIVGRVTANNGFGLPNARVSIFIPIESVDQSNPLISSIYPYKSPTDKNEDGYRYNLLPYEKSYSTHAATGTLPTRLDALTGNTAIEIYDKYYRLTAKTNESGDYMIMGVPLGYQTVVMDVDLSDIGEFSLTPQDLIRMGLATEGQVAGNRFRTSNNLNSLPQLVNLVKNLEISPLWGEQQVCDIAINRLDFDLRDEANIDIQPTSVFMGSIYSTPDSFRVRQNARPPDDMGNLCNLSTGPGQILAIRQTIAQDATGKPVLEQYQLEQSGNIIDGNGVWLTELPMNLDYYITNEFGEKVLSNDPTIGIPTKAKYRFKIKWAQPPSITEQTRRAYYLVPNVREYGWSSAAADPNYESTTSTNGIKLAGSYYFGLDWTGYTNTQAAINCDDTFYQFEFNRVYTVSGLIDEFKNGGRGRFIGIKEIDSQDCESTVNKFPVNEGFRNFDLLFFIFSIIFTVIQIIGVPLLIVFEFLAFLWNRFAVIILAYLAFTFGQNAVQNFISAGLAWPSFGLILPFVLKGALWTAITILILTKFSEIVKYRFGRVKLPMLTYPDCQACECTSESTAPGGGSPDDALPNSGAIAQLSNPSAYYDNLLSYEESTTSTPTSDPDYDTINQVSVLIKSQALAGYPSNASNPTRFKVPISQIGTYPDTNKQFAFSNTLPPAERINVYNTRKKYFDGVNKIQVTFASNQNTAHHFDNTITVLSGYDFEPGTLLTFVSPAKSTDKNYRWSGQTSGGTVQNGINGSIKVNPFNASVEYADPNNSSQNTNLVTTYLIPSGETQCVDSITLSFVSSGTPSGSTVTYNTCNSVKVTYIPTAGDILTGKTITNTDCIDIKSIAGTAEYIITASGDTCQRYSYPSDIEYFQVLTAITITKTVVAGVTQYSIPNLGPGTSIWSTLNSLNQISTFYEADCDGGRYGWKYNYTNQLQTSTFMDFNDQKILILQRGVDPYSPKLINKYGIGKILGYTNENDVVFTASTRMNIPIQKLPTGSYTSVQQHDNQDNIFYPSKFYSPGVAGSTIPGLQFSSYTTSNVGYYGALDAKTPYRKITTKNYGAFYSNNYVTTISIGSSHGVVSKTNNIYNTNHSEMPPATIGLYNSAISDSSYDLGEDLSGAAILDYNPFNWYHKCEGHWWNIFNPCDVCDYYFVYGPPAAVYFSPILYPTLTGTSELNITNSTKNVMRTDRLPSSDYIDNGGDLNGSVSLLQQNLGFSVYVVTSNGFSATSPGNSTGGSQVTPNIEGQLAAQNVLRTMNTCENMVGLNCYSGNGTNFGVSLGCQAEDTVENGCYVMMNDPLIDLKQDLNTFAEWGYRFRFYYGLCRGVLSQSFTNNWVNGSLYTFPIQVDTYFDSQNKPLPPEFAKELIYFDEKTNNFYYRSSPYYSASTTNQRFIGRPVTGLEDPVNSRNLLFPTTIVNLGIKDDFYQEIIFDPSAKAYIMRSLAPTSYSDTSDLVNLFVISRITDEGFLARIISGLNNSLNQLFSRPKLRIDGDLAQSMSINSEYGVIPFSPEFYSIYGNSDDPVVILGGLDNPTMGIFFSSTTVDLQNKDFLTPGVIDFRPSNNANAITYPYGIKSQYVPFYQWQLKQPGIQNIFGSENNNWKTNQSSDINSTGIFGYYYQSLDRRNINSPTYFIGSNTQVSDVYERGYIFNVGPCYEGVTNGNYSYYDCEHVLRTGNNVGTTVFYTSIGFGITPSGNPPVMRYSYYAGNYPQKFLVSAPYHFYFGLIKGETALDKFKTKYSVDE